MSFGQFGNFFIDSSVLLPQAVDVVKQSCDDFLSKNYSQCLISSSVKTEGLDLIERSHSVVIDDLKNNLKPFLDSQGITEITNKQGRLFADFFSQRRRIIKKTNTTRSNVPNQLLGIIENYVASRLHSLDDGQKIDTNLFLGALIRELSTERYRLQKHFDKLDCVKITPDDSLTCFVISCGKVSKRDDAEHLVSSIMHEFKENKWMIFVTNDDVHILSNKPELLDIFALQCSKPEWATDYVQFISHRKSPIEHYRELKNYSVAQKNFGNHIKKILEVELVY